LAGRIHSYVDTQISRLGGPNFHEIPINAPLAPVHNNQRDGMHRQAIHRGRVAYEPNSLAGGCPFQAGMDGFVSFPEPETGDELRGHPEKFAEHYNQATLFYDSQADWEKRHIADAYAFELSKVTVPAVRQRMVASLRNVSEELAQGVADQLGMALPAPLPRAIERPPKPEVEVSPALSLAARPGDGAIATRKVAILVAEGADGKSVSAVAQGLIAAGAIVRLVGQRIGPVPAAGGGTLDADASLDNHPSALFDGVVAAGGEAAVARLESDGRALEFLRDAYRHGKTLMGMGEGVQLLAAAGLSADTADGGLLRMDAAAAAKSVTAFIEALGRHRHPERETTPPRV
jgi:catalase